MNKYLVKLLYKRQALRVLREVPAAWVVLVHDAQARHAITKRSELIVDAYTVALLDYVVCCLFQVPTVCCVARARRQTVNSLITCASGSCACLVVQAGEKTRGWLDMVAQAWQCSGVWILLLDSAVRRNWGCQLGS
jgi:hypothetical protein